MLTREVLSAFREHVEKKAETHVLTIDPDDAKEYDRAMITANSGNRRQGNVSAINFNVAGSRFGKSHFGGNMGGVRFKDNYSGKGMQIPQGF